MPTIGSILSTATTALRTQQGALDVTSHNIANSATEGYTRQRAIITPLPALRTPDGVFGTGVSIADVAQVRDALLDASYRTESGDASQHQARSDALTRIETILNEPSDLGLSAILDQFFNSWSDLATNPGDTSARTVIRQQGIQIVDKLHETMSNLDQIRQQTETRLTQGVERLNDLTSEVARLNREIVTIEADGTTAGDLRDTRARALDELATLAPIKVVERDDGSVGVAMAGYNIVDGPDSRPLQVVQSGGTFGLELVSRPGMLSESGGALGGLIEFLNTDLPDAQASMNELAAALADDVNALHATGTNPDGDTGIDFFTYDPASAAWSLSLSNEVQASATAIAAGTPDGGGLYRAGANDVALSISGLRDEELTGLGATAADHFRGLVSSVGLAVRSSSDAAEVHQTLADQADTRRMGVSGVSVDEELVNMIQFQSAYQAAARIVTAADEMLQSLLAI